MSKQRGAFLIALAVIVLELLGGMQAYLSQLILPIMAKDLGARDSYGLVMGVAEIAAMTGLPIGAALMTKVRLPRLLLLATLALISGAVVSAFAPNIVVYLFGTLIRSFSGSVLALTSIGAVAVGLSGRARQLTLAFSSASWVVSSIVGPSYAAWVTHLWSWRWAMLLYLPLLLVARVVIALNLKKQSDQKEAPISYTALLLIIIGVSLTVIPSSGALKVVLLILGAMTLGWVVKLLMPEGTFLGNTPRRAALAGMFFLTGCYFSANELVGLTAHDVFHAEADILGVILMGGGLSWALVGVYCGLRPASTRARYRLRSRLGIGLILLSAVLLATWSMTQWDFELRSVILVFVWSVAGLGMGFVYLDTMNIFFEDPGQPDGITIEEMASASVIVESLASTMFVPLIASLVANAFLPGREFSSAPYGISWMIVSVLAIAALVFLERSAPSSGSST